MVSGAVRRGRAPCRSATSAPRECSRCGGGAVLRRGGRREELEIGWRVWGRGVERGCRGLANGGWVGWMHMGFVLVLGGQWGPAVVDAADFARQNALHVGGGGDCVELELASAAGLQ